jgi:xanthine phosphoribosyltransferase
VEASGIALATICAEEYGVPLIFAKKAKSDNIEGGLYKSDIYSYTYKKKVTLIVASQWLGKNDKVLIIDDFLANGEALRGLVEIVQEAGADLMGIGVAIEKGFQPGGQKLRDAGIHLESLAIVENADENGITFRGE